MASQFSTILFNPFWSKNEMTLTWPLIPKWYNGLVYVHLSWFIGQVRETDLWGSPITSSTGIFPSMKIKSDIKSSCHILQDCMTLAAISLLLLFLYISKENLSSLILNKLNKNIKKYLGWFLSKMNISFVRMSLTIIHFLQFNFTWRKPIKQFNTILKKKKIRSSLL